MVRRKRKKNTSKVGMQEKNTIQYNTEGRWCKEIAEIEAETMSLYKRRKNIETTRDEGGNESMTQ